MKAGSHGIKLRPAAEKVADDYKRFLEHNLGRGRRGRQSEDRGRNIDETVRTVYYKFLKRRGRAASQPTAGDATKREGVQGSTSSQGERRPEIDLLLEIWFWDYVHWFDWVVGVGERVIELTVRDYDRLGDPESASAFRAFADRVRRNPRLWHPAVGWPYRRIPLGGGDISASVAVSSLPL
jgi:hypothetical protein